MKYVNSVQASDTKIQYNSPNLHTKPKLITALKGKLGNKHNILLKEKLKGGTISQVYRGLLDNKRVVIKHTEDLIPYNPTELFLSRQSHNVDSNILKLLEKNPEIKSPKVLYHFEDITTTIMEDLSDFTLLLNKILQKSFTINGEKIGQMLALFVEETKKWKNIKALVSAEENMYERGFELLLFYPNDKKYFLDVKKEFTKNNKYITWLDAHPKNIFVHDQGDPAFIDFGFSSFVDSRLTIANFIAHIFIYGLAGYIIRENAINFIKSVIDGYGKVDEDIFCKYVGMEVLHRANGKWIDGVNAVDQKLKLAKFGMNVFDNDVKKIFQLFDLFFNI